MKQEKFSIFLQAGEKKDEEDPLGVFGFGEVYPRSSTVFA